MARSPRIDLNTHLASTTRPDVTVKALWIISILTALMWTSWYTL